MSEPVPPDPSTVGQIGAAIGLGAAAAIGAVWQWLKGARDGKDERKQIVLDAFDVADMQPVRELIREARAALPLIRETLKLLADLHAKRDRADERTSSMWAEHRDVLMRIDARLQDIEIEIKVMGRGGRR